MRPGVAGVFTDLPDTGVRAVAQVPEPGTHALFLLGLGTVAAGAWRRR